MRAKRITLLAAQGLLNLILILSPLACTKQEQAQEPGTTQEQQREEEKPQEGTQTP